GPYRYVRASAWAGGPFMLAATVLFWGVLGHNIPPYSAGLSADEVAQKIIANATEVRIGMAIMMLLAILYFVWGVAVAKVMEVVERENKDNNVLSTMAYFSWALTVMIFIMPCSMWLTISYRPEVMEPQTLMLLYDWSWILFDTSYSLTTLGMVAMGVCLMSDRREKPLVPRWVCWVSIADGVAFLLLSLMPFVYEGPLSRSGSLNYYAQFSVFFFYWLVVSIAIVRASGRLVREHRESSSIRT
uniref:hypothetical protein n=1 Tax=Sphingobium amiense TaxID=135719 RepID=UPI00082BEA20